MTDTTLDPATSELVRFASLPPPVPDSWPLDRICPGSFNRQLAIDDGIRELHHSMETMGQLQPVGVIDRPDDNLIYGFRRLLAMGLGWDKPVSVLVYPPTITRSQVRTLNATENLQRVDLTPPEIYTLCKELLELNPDWLQSDLSAHLSKSHGTITRYLSPAKLVAEPLAAFMAGQFGFNEAYAISRSPDQLETLRIRLSGGNREAIRRAIKAQGSPKREAPAERTEKLIVPSRDSVMIIKVRKGQEAMDLLTARAVISEASAKVEAAIREGIGIKAASLAWRDTKDRPKKVRKSRQANKSQS